MCLKFDFVAFGFLLHTLCKFVLGGSFNLPEINSIKYELKIVNQTHNLNSQIEDYITISSKYGDKFYCFLPIVNYPKEYHVSDKKALLRNISKALKPLKKECLKKSEGWWTYEFCYKKHIKQYHLEPSGNKRGMETVIGIYSHNDPYDSLGTSRTKSISHHKQYYTNGTWCSLSHAPREALVQISCKPDQPSRIVFVQEADCMYTLKIETPLLCGVPFFNKTAQTLNYAINCHVEKLINSDINTDSLLEMPTEQYHNTSSLIPNAESNLIPEAKPTIMEPPEKKVRYRILSGDPRFLSTDLIKNLLEGFIGSDSSDSQSRKTFQELNKGYVNNRKEPMSPSNLTKNIIVIKNRL